MFRAILLTGSAFVPALAAAQEAPLPPENSAASPPPAATTAPGPAADDIVVTGVRASLRSAQELKRNSDSILDAVVAEDIGKLPDNNASEALARVTGVQVNRSTDEANGVLIRGLPDVTTTFNGREIFTAENRGVALQDFPAGALAALEVYKSGTADLIEPGLAGLVNVRSRRPFDFKGFEIAGGIRGNYNDQSGKLDPVGNLLITDRWDTGIGEIGALVNFAITRTRYRNAVRFNDQTTRTPVGDVNNLTDDLTVATPDVGTAFRIPNSVGNYFATGTRTRPSLNGSLQWRPSDRLEIYADGLWQAYRGEQSNENFTALLEAETLALPGQNGTRPTLSNVVLDPDDPRKVISLTKTGGLAPQQFRSTFNDRTDTYQGAIGFIWKGDRARISSDYAYTYSTYSQLEYSLDARFASSPRTDVEFDRDGGASFTFPGFDALNPDNYIWRGFYQKRYHASGSGHQWRADLQLDTDLPVVQRLDFGVRWVSRTGRLEQGDRYLATDALGIPLASLPTGQLETVQDGFRQPAAQFRNWLMPSRASIRSNFDALRALTYSVGPRLIARDPNNVDLRDSVARFAQEEIALRPDGGFRAQESTYAAYALAHYDFEVGGVEIDGTAGVRVVNNDGTYRGVTRLVTDGAISFLSQVNRQNYVDVLPSFGARLQFTPKLQARLGYTETRTRPSFSQLNPAFNITRNTATGAAFDASGSGGNPGLVPLTSNNWDATLEWYFAPTGSFTASVFYRDLFGFISTYTTIVQDPTYGRLQVSRPENAGAGTIKGAEANFQTFFDFLPGLLSGFGTQLNVTYLDGTNRLPSALGEAAPIVPITGVSKWTYNITGFYEKGPVSARLSYNRRSSYVDSFTRNPGEAQFAGVSVLPISRLDFSAAYTPFENITFTADVTNILAQPFRNFRNFAADAGYPVDVREEGRFYSLGLRFRF
ncbi:TonB-dependent receptor [Sphingomonas sp. BE138]|uniref:TonB-dependent receptor n=1 Tax=Sphingomonas sp. BE138 TaxID=2817845 RepID=UPI00286605AE|nr:TonB-dependent receptor [Sphingomonas sp. BE138]MDR6788424.1 TonB-dependent receptor [Sphingomonas sp. BE138]